MLTRLSAIRTLLHQMEVESGLSALTEHQRDVIYAAADVAGEDNRALLRDIVAHPLVQDMARPTFFRAIKCLLDLGRIERVGSKRSGVYRVISY